MQLTQMCPPALLKFRRIPWLLFDQRSVKIVAHKFIHDKSSENIEVTLFGLQSLP